VKCAFDNISNDVFVRHAISPATEEENNHGCVEDDEILIDSSSTSNLYELEVGESDFAKLWQDQALVLLDFSAFSKS